MATLNTERLREMPPLIEDVRKTYETDLSSAAETIKELAKQTGSGQFMKDAEQFAVCVEKVSTMIKNVLGQEGDTMGTEGTVYAAYEAGKKIEKAMGGDM